MREIKFRAWDKEDKRMIIDEQDFIPVKVTNKGVLRLNPHHKENFWEFIDEERFEIMQYTGIKDKNGKEIYEGDVLKNDYGELWVVVWEGTGFMLSLFGDSKNIYSANEYYFSSCEVIGNIYKNPELLEGEE